MKSIFIFMFVLLTTFTGSDRVKLYTESKPGAKIYSYFPLCTKFMQFNIKGTNDANILLSNSYSTNDAIYEIVLGAYGNTRAVLRRNTQQEIFVDEYPKGLLDRNEYRNFWVSINEDRQSVSMGIGTNYNNTLLTHTYLHNTRFSIFGISSGWNGTAYWDFDFDETFGCMQKKCCNKCS